MAAANSEISFTLSQPIDLFAICITWPTFETVHLKTDVSVCSQIWY